MGCQELGVEHARIRLNRGADRVHVTDLDADRVTDLDESDLDVIVGRLFVHVDVGPVVDVVRGDDVITGAGERAERRRNHRHAGGSGDGRFGALEFCDFRFDGRGRRVAAARMELASGLAAQLRRLIFE
ncbi:MAG TPA: hypothetical protein VHV31_17020, partial [Nitrolancea sp.]|nr:hypothetical protein [Nitrolancea sp.]